MDLLSKEETNSFNKKALLDITEGKYYSKLNLSTEVARFLEKVARFRQKVARLFRKVARFSVKVARLFQKHNFFIFNNGHNSCGLELYLFFYVLIFYI